MLPAIPELERDFAVTRMGIGRNLAHHEFGKLRIIEIPGPRQFLSLIFHPGPEASLRGEYIVRISILHGEISAKESNVSILHLRKFLQI